MPHPLMQHYFLAITTVAAEMYRVEGGPHQPEKTKANHIIKKCNILQFVMKKILATELSN